MPSLSRREPLGALERPGLQAREAVPQLVGHRVLLGHPLLLEEGEPVLAQADLGQLRELVGELLGRRSRLTGGHDAVHQPDPLSLLGVDLTPGEDQVQRAAGADQPGQPDRAAVDERDAPATAEDAEPGVRRRDPEVAPDRELEATGDGVPLDGGEHRLAQPHPGRAHRAVAGLLHLVAALGPDGLEVGAGAEGAAVAVQHRDAGALVGVEGSERVGQGRRGGAVDGVAGVRAVQDHRRDRAVVLDADWLGAVASHGRDASRSFGTQDQTGPPVQCPKG